MLPADFISPMSKQNLSLWRLAHIAALAYVAATFIPQAVRWLASSWAAPIIQCGSHSLPVFCAGIILSNAAFVATEEFGSGVAVQSAVNILGLAILSYTGWWFAEAKRERATLRWLRAQRARFSVLQQRYRGLPVATKELRQD